MRFLLLCLVLVGLLGCARPFVSTHDAGRGDTGLDDTDGAVLDDAASDVDASLPTYPTIASLLESGNSALFVGNSYTYVNDLPLVYREASMLLPPTPVRVESVTAGGYLLAQHATDAMTDGTALATFLRTGTAEETAWDVVVLQEQSQIPGFPEGNPERDASLDGASALGQLALARNASVVLYLTWGRELGDETNPGLYPDFQTMEDMLEDGYRAMSVRLASEGVDVRIAPVGPAFERVHADVVAAGGDPTAEGSDFDLLYDSDGSHPAPRGTYLAMCVILGTITGLDPFTFPDGAGLTPDEARAMRLVARATLADPTWTP
jgi:hypothetical protein